MDNVKPDGVLYLGVMFTDTEVGRILDGNFDLFIPKEKIRHIRLLWGNKAERPLVELIFGLVCLSVAVWALVNVGFWLIFGGTISYAYFICPAMLLPMGGWMMYDGARRGMFLEVELDNDRRKLPFRSIPDPTTLQPFLSQARGMGFVIEAP